MDKFYKNCNCMRWIDNCKIIDSALIMQGLRGGEKLKNSFDHCPWCGEELQYADHETTAKPKVVILDDNPLSMAKYAEEYPENFKEISDADHEKGDGSK